MKAVALMDLLDFKLSKNSGLKMGSKLYPSSMICKFIRHCATTQFQKAVGKNGRCKAVRKSGSRYLNICLLNKTPASFWLCLGKGSADRFHLVFTKVS